MRNFLFKSFGFIFLFIPILIVIGLFFKLDGYLDPFYLRFTTPKQTSLILGTSRAAQGIQPAVINNLLRRSDVYNFAFTIAHSPYGPTYLKAIKNKLRNETKNGIFIVTVDPWCISGPIKTPNDSTHFIECGLALGETNEINMNPNIFYLLRWYDKSYFKLFSDDKSSGMFLHDDGWLEIIISMDRNSVSKRIESKMEDYSENMLPSYKLSTLRMAYLIKTISFLQQHGKVFLVRLPVYPEMSAIEDKLMPDFDSKINCIASKMNIPYKSFRKIESEYQYVDGNHLYKGSGLKVSIAIGEWIKNMNNLIKL